MVADTCPRCGAAGAAIDPLHDEELRYEPATVTVASVECGCWPEPFLVRHDDRIHEPGEVVILGEAAIDTDEELAAALAGESHPDEVAVGWGRAA